MPYADPQKQREAQARWFRKKYEADAKFRDAEAERKAAWLQTPEGKQSNAESSARFRVKVVAEKTDGPKTKGHAKSRAAKAGRPKVPHTKVRSAKAGIGKTRGVALAKARGISTAKNTAGNRHRSGGVRLSTAKERGSASSKAESPAIEYHESEPKEMKSFAKMVKTLQTAGVKFAIGRTGRRLTLLVG